MTADQGRPGLGRSVLDHLRDPVAMRRTLITALIVGTLLTAVNHAGVLAEGVPDAVLGAKVFANYLIPWCVSSIGYISARRAGWIPPADVAPAGSRPHLDAAQKKFGMIPNLLGMLATAPAALGGYLTVTGEMEGSSLSPIEQQVVFIATSAENRCEYCVGVHSAIAGMVNMPEDALGALREGRDPADPRLGALARFTRHVVDQRGWVDDGELEAFLAAGYGEQQVLEVVTGVALKTLSNYANHIAGTPLDAAFAPMSWTAEVAA